MKFVFSTLLMTAAIAKAHTIFQRVSVNGADQGYLVGLRAPSDDYPLYSATDSNLACQKPGSRSSTVINVAAGARIGTLWGHVLGGAQYPGDPDNPIASSHKGPIQAYLAPVSNAATTSSSGLRWFKVASEGLSGGRWAVDTMISGGGWWYFTLPTCIAPGNYLLRVELLALHSAYDTNGSQFYVSCAQINVTGGGSFSPSSTVSFPGAYSPSDPGILINIYGSAGKPDNGGKAYKPPGPAVITCNGGNNTPVSTPRASSTARPASSVRPNSTSSANGTGQTLYGQCGGQGWTGPTTCASGTCKYSNAYYSQCVP